MPKFLENKLKAEASAKGFTGRRAAKYVYGAMNNMGAMRGNKETAKGAKMEAKHQRDVVPKNLSERMHTPEAQAEMSRFRTESHNADFRRPKKKVVSRYS